MRPAQALMKTRTRLSWAPKTCSGSPAPFVGCLPPLAETSPGEPRDSAGGPWAAVSGEESQLKVKTRSGARDLEGSLALPIAFVVITHATSVCCHWCP